MSWLFTFVYRVSIGQGDFALSGLIALAITLATVCYHAATADRVDSLRSE